jgi:shikimate dehydrogenase
MKRLAVLGHPVGHSRSPAMHNAAFAELGLADEWSYEAIDVSPEEFADRVGAMRAEGFVGANVTVPHKAAALELVDDASEVASAIGASNTLSFERDAIRADNTDATGFLASLPEPPTGKRALVLGAGGAARAVVWALAGEGAEVEVWNRTPERAERLASAFAVTVVATPAPDREDWRLRTEDFDLIVNATSVGMGASRHGGEATGLKALRMDADVLHHRQLVVDLAYGPDETDLTRAARERGATVVDGIEVLVRQGAESFRIWTGIDPPLEAMRRAVRG